MPRTILFLALIVSWVFTPSSATYAQLPDDLRQTKQQIAGRGLAFLRDHGQAADGTFSIRAGSGITSLAITASLRHTRSLDDPMVVRGVKALLSFAKPDGGIYANDRLKNYETCVAIVALSEANRIAGDGRYDEILKKAERYVRGMQIGANGATNEADPQFGGVGYGGPERPDLSNTVYLLEALRALDVQDNDPAIQRALVFVSRCQNLAGHGNDTAYAKLVNDGGFYYVIPTEKVDPSTSERYEANGGLRSYGSMTYSGFKSLIYAGLTKDDPRAQAALDWISKHYSVEANPGQGTAGLYYYYHTFGSALAASGQTTISTSDQGPRDWRVDLIKQLASSQRTDGAWVNADQRWMESDANLSTSFALLALSYCESQPNTPPKP